ncbi:MAG: hypothetical protein HYX87_06820 [Chloroflexi bacterium]|nr:hypothetical protein [Chloroflexota bacterium]
MAINEEREPKVQTPGTLVLALIFLAFFALMVLANYRLLSEAWPIR